MSTNIRLIEGGKHIRQTAKEIVIKGNQLDIDALERVCSNLRNRHGLSAIPFKKTGEYQSLLVLSKKSLHEVRLKEGNWEVELIDNEKIISLNLETNYQSELFVDLMLRGIYARLERGNKFWRLNSPNIWYEHYPLKTLQGINAFRRYRISGHFLESVGVGYSVNVETAFFDSNSVQTYFKSNQEYRFNQLTSRQEGAKGTLLYKGNKQQSCHFVSFCHGLTCATTTPMSLGGNRYENLFDYYEKTYPNLRVSPDDSVAKVSFGGTKSEPVMVCANQLFVRVMNDSLPVGLKMLDKILPQDRKYLEEMFWKAIGETPFQHSSLTLSKQDWNPPKEAKFRIPFPNILFGQGRILEAPVTFTPESYHEHFVNINRAMDSVGCYHVQANIPRKIYFAFSDQVNVKIQQNFVEDMIRRLTFLTGKTIEGEILNYSYSHSEIFLQLQPQNAGMVVFAMNNDPTIYYDIEYELKRFSIKRILESTLNKKASESFNKWKSFINLCALDVAVQMGCILYLPELTDYYDGMLVIDVGKKSKFFGVSLMINRIEGRKKVPFFVSNTFPKADYKSKESINEEQLMRRIMDVFNDASKRVRYDTLKSLLVVRDGRLCGTEHKGIEKAKQCLIEQRVFSPDVRLDLVDLHKTSVKQIRLVKNWDSKIGNVLEGCGFLLDSKNMILSTTGAGTLRNGTASPLSIEAQSSNVDLLKVAEYLFQTAQFNFGNPQVAQRLPFPIKELDDKLQIKLLQHIPVRG